MLISHDWLQHYLPDLHRFTMEEISEALTSSLAEVEEIVPIRHLLSDIIAGEVTEVNKLNNKLYKCSVKISDKQTYTIVCGAPNLYVGQKVAVCLPGGSVIDPKNPEQSLQITARNVKDTTSQGMICSPMELGISEQHDVILELEPEMNIGESISELLKDSVFEIENKSLSHRSDCFSHEGIARELSAILKIEFLPTPIEEVPFAIDKKLDIDINIRVDDEHCPRFTAVLLKDVTVKDSPIWIKSRLSAIDIRPINNIVDLTNYIMMDKGNPLHAYDYDKINGGKLIVRYAKENEIVKTLDGKTHKLNDKMIIIADKSNIEDIAGIMGGYRTQITKKTRNILLESANWNMYSIRKTARTLGIRSEASTRFEKGLDPNSTKDSLQLAIQLLFDISDGEVASDYIDTYKKPEELKELTLDMSLVSRFLGIKLSRTQIIEILKGLHFVVHEEEKVDKAKLNIHVDPSITVTVPSFRRDINIQQDLLEEIVRIFGYANINPALPLKDLTPVKLSKTTRLHRTVCNYLVLTGMDEIKTYSFTGKGNYSNSLLDINDCIDIVNPLTPKLTHMRNSLIPNMLSKIEENAHQFGDFNFFEIGRVIHKRIRNNGLHHQPWNICGMIFRKDVDDTFFSIKGIVESLFNYLRIDAKITKLNSQKFLSQAAYHPERVTSITSKDKVLGHLGEISPESLEKWKIKGRVGVFQLNLDRLIKLYSNTTSYNPVSHYQAVKRDLSFWFSDKTQYADITDLISKLETKLVKDIQLKDVYKEEKKNRKSIALTITLQSTTRTLTEKDINNVISKIVQTVEQKLQGKLRRKR